MENSGPATHRTHNTNVTTFKRDMNAVRTEVIQSSINYLSQRLDLEQETTLQSVIALTSAVSDDTFIEAAKPLFKLMPPHFSPKEFTREVLAEFHHLRPPSVIKSDDYGVRTFHMLRSAKCSANAFSPCCHMPTFYETGALCPST